jgi:molecular chaperone HtpG
METKWENTVFTRVDSDIADNLIDKSEQQHVALTEDEQKKLTDWYTTLVNNPGLKIECRGLSTDAQPAIITRPEMSRRMKDMASVNPQMSWYANMPDELILTYNGNHPIYQTLLKEENDEVRESKLKNLADLAMLSQGLLNGEALTAFVERSVGLMQAQEA